MKTLLRILQTHFCSAFAGLALFLLLPQIGIGQTPDCQFTYTTTTATRQSPAIQNRPTSTDGGPGCTAWTFRYWTNASSATSVQLDGSPDVFSGGTHQPSGSWSALTVSSASGSGSNPATGTTEGSAVLCCDYAPWISVQVNTLTSSGAGTTITVRVYGYKTNSALVGGGGGGAPSGPAGGALAGNYPNPTLAAMTTLGDTIAGISAGLPVRVPGNTSTSPKCYLQTGDGVNSALPSWQPCPATTTLLYYMQNSILSSGTYTSGGSITGTVGQTCTLTAFNGGGTGATATVALTGSNVIAGGTAIVVTAAGSQYTSAPTSATLGNGTATCSGTATLSTILNVPSSDLSPVLPLAVVPYSPKTTMAYTINTGTSTTDEQSWVSPAGSPGVTFIPAGIYECHVHASRNNPFSGGATIQCRFDEVDATGAFIATIGTTEPSAGLTLLEVEYTMDFADGNIYTLASSTSRIKVTVQLVQTTVGVAGVLDLYVGGTADSHVLLPSPSTPAAVSSVYGLTGTVNPSAHNQSAALACPSVGASHTTYACTTSPAFVPVANDCILLIADLANVGDSTLAVNGAAALHILKQQNGATLANNDILANGRILMCMDAASHWQMQGQIGNAPGGATIAATTNTIKGDGAGNGVAVTGTASDCVHVDGGSAPCGGGGATVSPPYVISGGVNYGPVFQMTPPPALQGVATTLNNGGTCHAADVTCVVTSSAGFPAVPFIVQIGTENIEVTLVVSTTWTLVRGFDGSSAADHADGSAVTLNNLTWVNQGTAAATFTNGAMNFNTPAVSGDQLRLLCQLLPTPPYTATVGFLQSNPVVNFLPTGMALYSSSAGSVVNWANYNDAGDGGFGFRANKFTNVSTFNAVYTLNSGAHVIPMTGFVGGPMFLRIVDDGVNRLLQASADNVTFQEFFSVSRTDFLTPDQVCLMIDANNTNYKAVMQVLHLLVTTP